MFVPKADQAFAELRTNYPADKAPAEQGHLVAAMAPLYAQDGKVLFVPLGARLGSGNFAHAEDYGAYGHIQAKARAFVVGMPRPDALSFYYIRQGADLERAFEAGDGDIDTTSDGLLLNKVDPVTAALMASGATPPMPLGGALGGQLAEAVTQEDQCKVLLAWVKPFAGEDGFAAHMTVEEILKRMAGAFADDVFVPVFGVPYRMLVRDERRTLYQLLPRCGRTLGIRALSQKSIVDNFATEISQKWMAQRVIERAEALAWLAEKRKLIEALPDESASLQELKRIEKQAEQGLRALSEPERNQFSELAVARGIDIEGILLRRRVAEITDAPGIQDGLGQLVAAKRSIDGSKASPEVKSDLLRDVKKKATEITASLYQVEREKAAVVPHSLDGLSTMHSIRLRMARLAATMRDSFDLDTGDGLRTAVEQEQTLLADPAIQSAFRDRMMAVEPDGDPVDSVREAASAYLDLDRLGNDSPPFGAYTRAVEEAGTHAEIASIDFSDVSGMSNTSEPTAQELLILVLQRVHDVNDGIRDREGRCLARDYQNDPVLAMSCLQIMTVTNGQGGFRVRLKSFSKLGCVAAGSGGSQFDCQFETALANNSSMFMGELGRMFSMPGVQTARLVHGANGGWTMIY